VPFLDADGNIVLCLANYEHVVLADDDIDELFIKNLIAMVQFNGAFRFAYSNGGLAKQWESANRLGLQEYVF